jgi:hypothetical protein
MNSDDDKVETVQGSLESFGWQRRPDLDTPAARAWERPDGQIWLTDSRSPNPILVRLKGKIKWPEIPNADG